MGEPVAVTWGVFSGKDIIQPTVVDPVSFRVWKDEAFALWLEKWGRLYSDTDEASYKVLHDIRDSHLLVNLVDNNFPAENCLWSLLDQMLLSPMWGEKLESEKDVWEVFACYLSGEKNRHEVVVKCLPWSDYEIKTDGQTSLIRDKLVKLNRKGILTIKSQPNACAVPSDDKVFGWGEKNGFIFQKAYLKFFISRDHESRLLETLAKYPLVNYHVINHDGSIDVTNCEQAAEPMALTWGVFPGREIAQTKVVDPASFRASKDAAFDLWLEKWGHLYKADEASFKILHDIRQSHLLVNLVDNNFPGESCLWSLLDEVLLPY